MAAGPATAESSMEARIARLESDVGHLRSDVTEIKVDVRSLRDRIDGVDGRRIASRGKTSAIPRNRRPGEQE
jgi:septal ring factor EnvC (AmiA/AmiB activator)